MFSIRQFSIALLALALIFSCPISNAWIVPRAPISAVTGAFAYTRQTPVLFATTKTETESEEKEKQPDEEASRSNNSSIATAEKTSETKEEGIMEDNEDDEEDDDDEYEFIEYDTLTEADFLGSEWLVGTCWESNSKEIKETWVRLAAKDDKNIAIWGDNAQGKWSIDVASQFLAISKENIFGKKIWAGVVDDYYFLQGTVRGWSYLTPASVVGQWQAKRLGVDPEEAGTPPWFQETEEVEEETEGKP